MCSSPCSGESTNKRNDECKKTCYRAMKVLKIKSIVAMICILPGSQRRKLCWREHVL